MSKRDRAGKARKENRQAIDLQQQVRWMLHGWRPKGFQFGKGSAKGRGEDE